MVDLFHRRRATPVTVPTDTVIPLNYFDDFKILRSWIIDLTLRFDDVLDAQRLQRALARLMELGNWKRLGARLRKNVRFSRELFGSSIAGY